jgi:pimeloyl-ACP methyl ester carboxylesterase
MNDKIPADRHLQHVEFMQRWLIHAPPPPERKGNSYDAFISYRSSDRGWGMALYDALKLAGWDAFLDQYDLVPGTNLETSLAEALEASSSGVILWSSRTKDSAWCSNERNAMRTLKSRLGTFNYVFAKLDAEPLPLFAQADLYIDFEESPAGPRGVNLLKLMCGMSGVSLAPEAVEMAQQVDQDAAQILIAIKGAVDAENPARLIEIGTSAAPGVLASPIPVLTAAQGLISLGKYDDAREVLAYAQAHFPKSIRAKQLEGLALRRLERYQEAIDVLSELKAAGHQDPETLGILAAAWMAVTRRLGRRYISARRGSCIAPLSKAIRATITQVSTPRRNHSSWVNQPKPQRWPPTSCHWSSMRTTERISGLAARWVRSTSCSVISTPLPRNIKGLSTSIQPVSETSPGRTGRRREFALHKNYRRKTRRRPWLHSSCSIPSIERPCIATVHAIMYFRARTTQIIRVADLHTEQISNSELNSNRPKGDRLMNSSASKVRDHEWLDYYERFPYFSAEAVRDGCHPRIMEHKGSTAKAIVLIHGLTDSPYFMTAIGDHFFRNLGYNVYLPLLQCHGLKDPKGMEDVSLDEWKANVNFAADIAASKAAEVSIGGLSTGGALSFSTAVRNPSINGTVYLFSAALDLAGGLGGVVGELAGNLLGELKERLLRTPVADLADFFDNAKPLIGNDPYRYARMDLDGARELSMLIEETDALINGFNPKAPFSKRVFAAHSESDATADITGIETLKKVSAPGKFVFYRIPEAAGVSHVSLVLKEPIYSIGTSPSAKPLVKANPQFQDMMGAIATLERSV